MSAPLVAAPARRSRLRRWLHRLFWLAVLVCAYLLVFGWTAVVTPPAQVQKPTTVVVLYDQLHRGLLLPQPDGGFVEFGFGDWHWTARGEDSWTQLFQTVLWPTPGALAQRRHPQTDLAALGAAMPRVGLAALAVDADDAELLRQELVAQFKAGSHNDTYRTGLRMHFVPMDRAYWFLDNSATVLLEWLRRLHCEVSTPPLALDLRIAPG